MEKEDIFRLVLISKDTTEIIYEGSEDSCNAKRLELSLNYNSESLKVIKVTEKDKDKDKDDKQQSTDKSFRVDIGKIIEILTLGFIGWMFNKEGGKK